MNGDNKKATVLWTYRLFKQSNTPVVVSQTKTYFAHRYHNVLTALERTPFSALFSSVDKEQIDQEPNSAKIQRFFEGETPHFKDNIGAVESVQARASNLNLQFTVVNCYAETPDTKTFRFGRAADGLNFDYLPGQYVTLSVVISGQEYKRSYSLASTPSHQGILEITVKRDQNGGVVSNWLNDHLKIGDTVNLKGPFGKFSCANCIPQKILFLAAGSGVVPIMSMLRWLTDTEVRVDIMLLLSFRTPEDIIYADELKLISARHKNINLVITLTTDEKAGKQWPGLTGRINEKMLNESVTDLSERTVYLCGPQIFMAECKKNLLNLTVPAGKIFCESFSVNSTATKAQDSVIGRPSRKRMGSYRIRFAKSGKIITTDGRITLLELAEKYGIAIDHECRAGNCGECMIKCLKGKIDMTDQAEIADLDRKKGWIYACCSYPASNAVLDA